MSLRSTLRLTNSSSRSSSLPQSNSSFQLLSKKANSLAKVRRRDRSNSYPDRNNSHNKSSKQRDRCSATPAFLRATRRENSATPCRDRSPLNTSESTRFLTKFMLLRGLVRLVSLSTRMPEFFKKQSTSRSTCARYTPPSVLLYSSYSAPKPLRSRR